MERRGHGAAPARQLLEFLQFDVRLGETLAQAADGKAVIPQILKFVLVPQIAGIQRLEPDEKTVQPAARSLLM